MAFKLRSGNKAPFKQIGSDKETNAQCNARVKAEYEAQLQARSDSTASYKNQLERDKLQLDNADLWNTRNARQNILGFETKNFAFSEEERQEYARQRREVIKKQQVLATENFNRGIYSKFNREEGFEVGSDVSGGAGTDESADAYKGTKWQKALINRKDRNKLKNAEGTEKLKPSDNIIKPPVYREELSSYTPQPVKPKGDLRKPVELQETPSLGMKNIDMGQTNAPEPKQALPYELVKDNAKYFTTEMKGKRGGSYVKGEDGKSKINLRAQGGKLVFTGSQTKFTQKYGDVLKRGSKKYGQENREDRFYINK